jgi:hypothetical protein
MASEKATMEIEKKDKIQDISKDHVMTYDNLFITFRKIRLQIVRFNDTLGWPVGHSSTIIFE